MCKPYCSWLAEDPANVVHLQCASFGYEHIFMAISKKFKTKVRAGVFVCVCVFYTYLSLFTYKDSHCSVEDEGLPGYLCRD